ncbi:hypothetical protein AAHE18_07G135600 [Arachis hypogaea]
MSFFSFFASLSPPPSLSGESWSAPFLSTSFSLVPSRLLDSSSSSAPSLRSSLARSAIVAHRRICLQICRCSHRVVLFSAPPPAVNSSPIVASLSRSAVQICRCS